MNKLLSLEFWSFPPENKTNVKSTLISKTEGNGTDLKYEIIWNMIFFFSLTENTFVLDDNQEYPLCCFGGLAPFFIKSHVLRKHLFEQSLFFVLGFA